MNLWEYELDPEWLSNQKVRTIWKNSHTILYSDHINHIYVHIIVPLWCMICHCSDRTPLVAWIKIAMWYNSIQTNRCIAQHLTRGYFIWPSRHVVSSKTQMWTLIARLLFYLVFAGGHCWFAVFYWRAGIIRRDLVTLAEDWFPRRWSCRCRVVTDSLTGASSSFSISEFPQLLTITVWPTVTPGDVLVTQSDNACLCNQQISQTIP